MPSKDEYYDESCANPSDAHWLDWLQKQLRIRDINAATPDVPLAFKPDYQIWSKEYERYDVTPETILVGHSCGGGFLVRWLSENKDIRVGNVVLVAPWMNVNHEEDISFFDGFEIDSSIINRVNKLTIFSSTNDGIEMKNTINKLRQIIPGIGYREFTNYGHFTYGSMKTHEFPELLNEVT